MGASDNLGQQFGPESVWYKSSPSGADVWAYEKPSRKRIGVLQTYPRGWGQVEGQGNAGVNFIEISDPANRGRGIATGMYAKFHDRNPETVLVHDELTMSSHAKKMLPRLQETFPGKHLYRARGD